MTEEIMISNLKEIGKEIADLKKNQMTLNENLNMLEASYTNSMKLITASLERLLRRVRKLEK